MKKRFLILSLLTFSSISLSACYVDLGFIKFGKKPSSNNQTQQEDRSGIAAYDWEKDKKAIQGYYSSIDSSKSGTTLLSSLKSLNLSKRTSLVGYSNMGTDSSSKFKFTDFDPATVQYNDQGVPFGTKVLSFYSGKSVTTFNREHVWPDSRGGNKVENDILMPRPTINAENSDRGNSTYITGMTDDKNGWDPVAAFESTIGVYKSIRGECARIIFYCMTAADGLTLNDNASNSGNNMGSITNLIEWACENPVNEREVRRNVGSQYLQGNRNAFVDHPEYACKIWGGTNDKTKSACQKANYSIK